MHIFHIIYFKAAFSTANRDILKRLILGVRTQILINVNVLQKWHSNVLAAHYVSRRNYQFCTARLIFQKLYFGIFYVFKSNVPFPQLFFLYEVIQS